MIEEITAPSTMRLLLRVEADPASTNGSGAPSQIETEISRSAYKKMGIATEKNWLAALPKAFIHVFPEQGD